jgi:hypothetical protein
MNNTFDDLKKVPYFNAMCYLFPIKIQSFFRPPHHKSAKIEKNVKKSIDIFYFQKSLQ